MKTIKRKVRAHRCNHYWQYENAIWQADPNDESTVAVGRCCAKCGEMQTAVAKDWHPLPKSYVDMREALQKISNN